ncbi:MAG: hypothetical protein DYG83_17540 [Candidatus Brocadia sp. AMX2]|uniref:Uncharacterized protein n=1 Tax=Candidatus Brocadia sinica JPN1 TaxID=1197129 RepID=A0ABQ0JST3_9BACT|nr:MULTISPECIES: hypothetical protein [Brocadia]KXK32256.1 MAG: hypothetical protein UZ01_00587 [Candidatus Brocadia sinica]MBC6934040.1 hypothetical protein [Candidatus Brocadia sp.]MBL1170332.1 hypothetical protein [Candidatus Brocadia sp. AMX1]NOG43367.1 hypothetical protein [Planctomycetota bacterium]KAA0241522.1 MAG: hypothetical protein EDM70_17805 [Candidatus Brocadia sp. AMX2]
MKGIIKHTLKKVTLELVYQVVDERTGEIITKVDEIKKKQDDDFRYLIQKMDTETGQLRGEIGGLRGELGQLRTEVKDDIKRLDGKIDQLNQRIDTIIQMLMTIQQGQK